MEATATPLREGGVPEALALWVAGFDTLSRAFGLVEVTEACGVGIDEAAQVYFALGAALELDWLAAQITALPTQDRWVAGARAAYRDDLLANHRALSIAVLSGGMADASAASRLQSWKGQNHRAVDAWSDTHG